jgi:glyoxylase-like metal-dependent hydrolase (beta-lactamase superfamily II)
MPPLNRRTLLAAIGTSLLVGPARAQGTPATPGGFAGRVFVNERGGLRLHTYMAAPQGALVTSHVIEGPGGLILVDGQFVPSAAAELKAYVASIGKPVARAILSHAHTDHRFGFHHLGRMPVHAGPVTARFLREAGAGLIAQRKADSSVPEIAGELAPGTETVAGDELRVRRVLNTEAPEIMVIEVPAANAVIVQDLVYNKVHAFVNRQMDQWIEVLRGLEQDGSGSALILAGHGEPTAPAELKGLVRYLETARPLIEARIGKEGEIKAVVEEMTRAFPDYRAAPLLELALSYALKA